MATTNGAIDTKELDLMWQFLQFGGQKSNIPGLKESCRLLRKMMMQKTAGQRGNVRGDVSFEDLPTIINCIVIEAMCLYLSGDLDLIEIRSNQKENNVETINVKLDEGALMPVRAFELDAGLDILSPADFMVRAHQNISIDTGVHVEIPTGYAGFLKSKSGLMRWNGIRTEGTIDSGYTGSIVATIFNDSDEDFTFCCGQKITQLVIVPILTPKVVQVDEIGGGDRGDSGFGSTGK